jgi:N-acetylglucosamine-6-sulfatase
MASTQSRRQFLRGAGCAATAAGLAALHGNTTAVAAAKRNIVFILIDDMRFDAMSCMGHPFLETPHLDALAANGLVFENCFVTTSLCSPSRATFLTGQYAHRHGVLNNGTLLPQELPTFPKELQSAGYDTAFVGKWHMGGSTDAPRPGFDRWVSFRGQGVYYNPVFNIDGEKVPREGYMTDLLTDYAEDFLKQPRGDQPFMLYLSHKAVHGDFHPAKRHEGRYSDKDYTRPETMANTDENYAGKPAWVRAQRQSWHGVDGMYNKKTHYDKFVRDYSETMLAVDDCVGRVVKTLRETSQLDSTLLVFTSDNGFLFGEHGLIDKRCMYEPSIRIPLIVHCPELVRGGTRRSELITNLDFCPTFVDAAGLDVPDSVQGRSFYGLVTGDQQEWRDEFLYEYFWERSFGQTPTVLGVRTDRYKFMQFHGMWDRYELYDIVNDPDERNNLLADYMIENEAGTLDRLIARNAPDDLKAIFNDMRGRLMRQLEVTGCRPEPRW